MIGDTLLYSGVYLAVISFLAICLTLYDKNAAQYGLWRIKERTLLIVSVIGGSIAMLIVMRMIRHKTKHAMFMVGVPVMILMQIVIALYVWWSLKGGAL